MPRKWYDAEVIDIKNLSPSTKSFLLKIKSEESFDFTPGQFITLDLPIGEKRLDRWRSYSIASKPNENNLIELCIVRADPGHGSKYFFEDVSLNTTLKFKGPEGSFCLNENLEDKNIVMICTGTGVAPFRSILASIGDSMHKYRSVDLIFGTRYKSGILYRDEFLEYEKKQANFNYHVATSREVYNGYQGYVHQLYLDKYQQITDTFVFYLCGWQNMVDEATKNLVNLGYQKSQIYTELYG